MGVRAHIGRLDAFTGGTDQFGLYVTSDDGTVIIDGTSNMFRIAATGTLSVTVSSGGGSNSSTTVLTEIEVTETPAAIFLVGPTGGGTQQRFPATYWGQNPSSDWYPRAWASMDVSGGNPRVNLHGHNQEIANLTFELRYYVLQQTAI